MEEHTAAGTRLFRNYAGEVRTDATPLSDAWALAHGWVAVTPLGLRSDIGRHPTHGERSAAAAVRDLVAAAARAAGLEAEGLASLAEN